MKPGPEVCSPLLDYLALSHYWTKVFQGPLKAVMSLVSFWFQQSISKVITFAEASWHPPKHLLIAQLVAMWCSLEEQDAVPYAPPNETMNHHHPSLHPSAGGLFPPLCSLRTEAWLQVQPLGCSPASPSARSRNSSWDNAWTELGQSLFSRLGVWKEENKNVLMRRFWRKMSRGILWKLTK